MKVSKSFLSAMPLGLLAGSGGVVIFTHVAPRVDSIALFVGFIAGAIVLSLLLKPEVHEPTCESRNTQSVSEQLHLAPGGNLVPMLPIEPGERLVAEQAHNEGEERFRILFEDAPVAYHEIDQNGAISRVNQTECNLLGFSRSELIGRPVWELVTPEERESSRSAVHKKLAGEQELVPFTREFMRRDGAHLVLEIHEKLIRNSSGAVAGIRTVMLDITEKKLLEEQLRQAQRLESIGRLAGGIAHDFNNFLTIISGRAELLLSAHAANAELRSALQPICEAASRATALTGQLLAYSRRQILEPKQLDLNRVVRSACQMLRPLIGEDIELKIVTAPELPPVTTDQAKLEQVIMNLAINARDAMPTGGVLTIETAKTALNAEYARRHMQALPGDYVMLAVSDTGLGIDEKTRARIFEPFFSTKELGKGTGLGLSVVYGIVKQSGGNIWVYSEPGKGTCFKVYLPAQAVKIETPAQAEPTAAASGSETLLLVEDEPEVRRLARESLEQRGYRILEAGSGAEALAICAEYKDRIDLLLTDVVMPGMSGRELASSLACLQPHMKVLYTSGYTDDTVIRHGVLQSGTAYLQKPFGLMTLASKVREVLDGVETSAGGSTQDSTAPSRQWSMRASSAS